MTSRAFTRNLAFALFTGLALGLAPVPASSADTDDSTPRIDMLHFWISPGEREALATISDEFERRGGIWSEISSANYETMKRDLIERVGSGLPPSVVLLLAGYDLRVLTELGIAHDMSDVLAESLERSAIYPFLEPLYDPDGRLFALPIAIHNEFRAWFNADIYRRLGLEPPRDWEDFFRQAEILEAAGIEPIAVSAEDAWIRILFTTMMAAIAGPYSYHGFFEKSDPEVLDTPDMRRFLHDFTRLRDLVGRTANSLGWEDATRAVIDGKAAMTIMGDWAKGEFTERGLEPTRDFLCRPLPGDYSQLIVAVDLFAFIEDPDPSVRRGQELFAEVMLDPKVQVAFSRAKGSVPARSDIPPDAMDECSAETMLHLSSQTLFTPRLVMPEQTFTDVQSATARFWRNNTMPMTDLIERFRAILSARNE
ncbi:MAG: ABC transporter substrate-binding protein [Geminicoccaceae bacterium]